MLTSTAYEDSLRSFWPRVRDFAVPPTMIETATVRRRQGDWAGACAAAGVDIDFDLRSLARTHGRELASRIRHDLRRLAPDLLRWHMPRVAPDGLLRPGLTMALARYDRPAGRNDADPVRPVHLVVRTPPAWADGGQRISLALWDGASGASRERFSFDSGARRHPHPRPSRRYRLDLHRHLWDTRRTDELRVRSGADLPTGHDRSGGGDPPGPGPGPGPVPVQVPRDLGCAVGRWAEEAAIVLRDEGRTTGTVAVRLGTGRWLLLDVAADPAGVGPPTLRITEAPAGWSGGDLTVPILPDAATWVLPDLALIRAGAVDPERLHPLVASALVPGHSPSGADRNAVPVGSGGYAGRSGVDRIVAASGADGNAAPSGVGGTVPPSGGDGNADASGGDGHAAPSGADRNAVPAGSGGYAVSSGGGGRVAPSGPGARLAPGATRLVECRGARHRIGLVDGVLAPLDHDPAEIRREELLVALTGTPLPCLRAIDEAHRQPECLHGVRERLRHGDTAGALAVVEGLLGPDAVLRGGALRDELRAAARRRLTYGLFRAGLTRPGPDGLAPGPVRPAGHRSHPRDTTGR
ncbi:hypothetical protein ACFVU0_12635 [Streptomyces sp. NPDC058122]|uniref:hypothetical protein n=1 Tax=Streptomyces sp. NPDC058122 TaxID=3346349 RepID=UPI0036E84993